MMQSNSFPPMRNRRNNESRRNALRTLRRRDTVGLLLLGDCESGKTALVTRWIHNFFTDDYKPTVEEFQVKSYKHLEQNINVGIIDMTGSWDFSAMIDLYLNRVDSVMFIYEVGSQKSIKNVINLYDRVIKVRGENHELTLSIVGTKIDCHQDVGDDFHDDGIDNLLKKIGGKEKHILTSSKLDINVNEAFDNAIGDVVANAIPNEDTIKRLGKLMKENGNKRSWLKKYCCFV